MKQDVGCEVVALTESPETYDTLNYHVVKQAEMVLAFTTFQPESNVCFGGTGWAVEMTKLLKKILYVYDVQRNIWFWYRHDQDLFYACDQMSEEQFALPTFLPKTADFPDALLQLQDTSKRSLNIPARFM